MACIALSGAVEICLSSPGIAGYDVFNNIEAAIGSQVHPHMQELGQVGNLIRGQQRERRHAFIGPSFFKDRADQFSLLVVKHDRRTNKVRTARAVCPGSVTEGAVWS